MDALGWQQCRPDINLNLPHQSAAETWLSFELQGAREGCSRNFIAVPRVGSGRAELMGFGAGERAWRALLRCTYDSTPFTFGVNIASVFWYSGRKTWHYSV